MLEGGVRNDPQVTHFQVLGFNELRAGVLRLVERC